MSAKERLDREVAELAAVVATAAKRDGDLVMIHLLAASEEASKRGEMSLAGHLLQLAGFRKSNRDRQVCDALAGEMHTYGRLVHGAGAA